MTTYFAGNELDAFKNTVSATSSTATDLIVSGVNRGGIALAGESAKAECVLSTAITEGWFHYKYLGVTAAGTSFAFASMAENVEGQALWSMGQYGFIQAKQNILRAPNGDTLIAGDPTANCDIYFKIGTAGVGIFRVWADQTLIYENLTDAVQFPSGTQSVTKIILRGGRDTTVKGYSQVVCSSLPTLGAKVYAVPLGTASLNDWSGTPANIQGQTPASFADALRADTNADRVLMAADNIPALGAGEFIDCVTLHAAASYDVGSPVTKLAPLINDGATTQLGTALTLSSLSNGYAFQYATNPFTSGVWTASEINALSLGFEAQT